ncbi:hypothetical protein CH063_01150 [Colletotrichum higginsianum]|uniref:Uncharacterized protein n=1 Tax=Colletotrichum higginsianum (strain IMI 349063) TaxID=759273 RepID=H1V2Q6_COLHI|nr:hypothetical protein CH63R_04331 [Colletotrichum higginsianum IMI 349063]OBR12035.1 hypothetical protein CH63R_04331 [Colletotrichum higginsianum IMI 349063]CCF34508.1 hypothetical protein CH063_01150 [Colletotrichum higginsianum]
MSETVRRASAGFSTISRSRSPRRIQPQLFHVRELSGQCAGPLCLWILRSRVSKGGCSFGLGGWTRRGDEIDSAR